MGFYARFFRLTAINILSNLVVPLAGWVNTAFLGHLDAIHYLAGVALTTILVNYIYWTFGFLRMGTTGMTAQAAGRGDRDAVLLTGMRGIVLALGLGILILLVQQPLREVGFWLLSGSEPVKAAGRDYFNALIWGAPATLANFALIGWFLGKSQSDRVLVLSLVGSAANIALDALLIGQWGWASAGAGVASAASQYFIMTIGLGFAAQELPRQEVRRLLPSLFALEAMRDMVALNSNIIIRTLVLLTTFSFFTNLGASLGTEVLTVNALLLQVVSFAAFFIDGIAYATETCAGMLQGERARDRLQSLLVVAGGISLGFGLVFAMAANLLTQQVFGTLTYHVEILRRVAAYTIWLFPILGFGSLAWMLDGYFIGMTAGVILRNSSFVASGLGFFPFAIAAFARSDNHLLWLALSGFMAARAISLGREVPKTLRTK